MSETIWARIIMSFLDEIRPADIIEMAGRGFKRFRPQRDTGKLVAQMSAGQYYSRSEGNVGAAPLALSWNFMRVLVPSLVFSFPRHVVETPFLPARQFADDIGTALSIQDKKLRITETYRAAIVDALHFGLGVFKTGLAASGDLIAVDAEESGSQKIDKGEIYTERVSFFNIVADPDSREWLFRDARFFGDIIRIPRQVLLDAEGYNKKLVKRLKPPNSPEEKDSAAGISMPGSDFGKNADDDDIVEIAELYIPSANAIITIPGNFEPMDDFLKVTDFYGVKDRTGPYTFLPLTQPVPDNPLPSAFLSALLDLEIKANRAESLIMQQMERQKDITLYSPELADEAAQLRDAADGFMVACSDPNGIKVQSYGGVQDKSSLPYLQMLLAQYNGIAANLESLSGQNSAAKSATAANILQQNAGIVLADMQDQVYQAAAQEARKRAFYIVNDPFLNQTLVRRVRNPGQMAQTPNGPQWVVPPSVQEIQAMLTPESKTGDFIDMTFTIEPESMGKLDSKTRLQQAMTFVQQMLPATAGAAQIFNSLGQPFDVSAFLLKLAKDMGITWLDEVLYSPEIQQQTAIKWNAVQAATNQQIPPNEQTPPPQMPNPALNPAMQQNGQPGQVQGRPPQPQQKQRAGAQAGAEDSQRLIHSALGAALHPGKAAPALPNLRALQ